MTKSLLIFLLLLLSDLTSASLKDHKKTIDDASKEEIIVDSIPPFAVYISEQGKLHPVSLPTGFNDDPQGVYDDIYVEDLSDDGVGEIVVRLATNGVNVCSKILHYNKTNRSLNELRFGDRNLCNFKVRRGFIISSYKNGAAWSEDIYTLQGEKVNAIVSDSCIGCGEVRRKKYGSDGTIVEFLVSDDIDFEKRTPLTARVSSLLAEIYSAPDAMQSSEKNLVRGDEVFLLGFEKLSGGENIVEFRLSGNIVIEGWLKCSDLNYNC
ncbi:hypothetical protein AABC73_17185 [Pseudomonas sp. G.S.17]|uniref:hypothetical protein n=1 Tax=Pseudomonas sp. G.S.17 TaxID=3137451 RepID=UPI00311CD579